MSDVCCFFCRGSSAMHNFLDELKVSFLVIDMVNTIRPDERSVMTYVAAYYHAFANAHNVCFHTFQILNKNLKI